jgi:hypothetical protein
MLTVGEIKRSSGQTRASKRFITTFTSTRGKSNEFGQASWKMKRVAMRAYEASAPERCGFDYIMAAPVRS